MKQNQHCRPRPRLTEAQRSRRALIASETLRSSRRRSKRDAVVDKQRVILPTGVADAVAGIQRARLRNRKSEARSDITKPVLAAEPIHHEIDLAADRLFVTCDGPALVAVPAGAAHQSVAAAGQSRPIIAAKLLAHGAVKHAKGV